MPVLEVIKALHKPKEIKVKPSPLIFEDEKGEGIAFYPDGDIIVYYDWADDYDQWCVNILDRTTFDSLREFIKKLKEES